MVNRKSMDELTLIAVVWWSIWRSRNEVVFSNYPPNPANNSKFAFSGNGDFIAAIFSDSRSPTAESNECNVQKCRRPPIGSKLAAFGVIVRDSKGSIIEVNHGRVNVLSALVAGARAIRVAVSMA